MDNCGTCGGCSNCGRCGGCARSLVLTPGEVELLRQFAQIPFLPVARKASDETPIYLETGNAAEIAPILVCLEKKGLIDIDYHLPLSGFDYTAYAAYPLHGSMALTQKGQEILDTIELQGMEEE